MAFPLAPEAAATILRWHIDAGADWVLDDAPHDRFAESRQATLARGASERDEPRSRDERHAPAAMSEAVTTSTSAPGRTAPAARQPRISAPAPAQRAAPVAPLEAADTARALAASAGNLE